MTDNTTRASDRMRPLLGLGLAAVALWVIYGVVVSRMIPASAERGLFGDMYGGINALFAALAFAGLIYTVLLQRTELRLQREELSQTREELAGQREQLTIQNATLRLQRFENTFFQLLQLHHEIVRSQEIISNGKHVHGRRGFEVIAQDLIHSASRLDGPEDATRWRLSEKYRESYALHQAVLGHYFRNLYHLVKLAHEAQVDDVRRYTSLVRAQLSGAEHILLFVNGLSQLGRDKFKPLIEEYCLLENMPIESVSFARDEFSAYAPSAFGSDYSEVEKLKA